MSGTVDLPEQASSTAMAGTEPAAGQTALRVLLVEDDPDVVEAVRQGFAQSRISVQHAGTLADGAKMLDQHPRFDAVVLDRTLPDGEGTELADLCRRSGNEIPILMVTAKDTVADRVAGLSHGADDYLCKPFAVEELSARLEAVLRRARPKHRHILNYADVMLDLLRRRVRRGDLESDLSAREMDLLAYLMCHPEEVLTREQILKDVWGDEGETDGNVLHVYANYLRNKIERGMYPRIIHTVRGVGYILSERDPEENPPPNLPW